MFDSLGVDSSNVINFVGLLAFTLVVGFFAFLGAIEVMDAEIAYWVGQFVFLALAVALPKIIRHVNE